MQRVGEPSTDELVDAVMTASRALLAVVARSLAAVDEDVTLPQYRALIVLAQRGARRPVDLAGVLAVTPSTATRMCDRLEARGLVGRDRVPDDRREVQVSLTARGLALVDEVTRRRRAELGTLLAGMAPRDRDAVVRALRTFAESAGEVPEQEWAVLP
ncbi:MarR family winged helix-turn-helix transcriptional regulator [Pseudonocardia oroxyli]|uniref:MarR family winged helix-turn-helix transcriptional regulator n=1 Tax=Pseudonocardia oroxyli TaxID=366584 RepID=UPI001FDF47C5|nr:MarR family transcriptional regulator [Pseudonocardia oroxyli]